MKFLYVLLAACSLSLGARAQTPTLLKDIYTGVEGSSPTRFFNYGDKVLFRAESAAEGTELWITDGTPAGTMMLADINADPSVSKGSSNPDNFIEYKGKVYFKAKGATVGDELYVTDGTPAGTMLVKDIQPGDKSSSPLDFIVYNDLLYFTANDGTTSSELWVTDGTPGGTRLAVDINPGGGTGIPNGKYVFGGRMYFSANNGTNGAELMSSDGTAAGTVLVKDIRAGSGNSLPSRFIAYDGALYFRANDGELGTELYRTDGTAAGTTRVIDLEPGDSRSSSNPDNFLVLGDYLVFTADDGTRGEELYYTSGDSTSTKRIPDLNVGSGGSDPEQFTTILEGVLYAFVADAGSGAGGAQIYTLGLDDVPELPSVDLLVDSVDLGGGADPEDLVFTGSHLYFSYESAATGRELGGLPFIAERDAFRVGEVGAGAIDGEIDDITVFGSRLVFEANDGTTGREPYAIESRYADVDLVTFDGEVIGDGDTLVLDQASLGLGALGLLAFSNSGNDTAAAIAVAFDEDLDRVAFDFGDDDPEDLRLPPGASNGFLLRVDPRGVGAQLDSILVGYTTIGGGELITVYLEYEAVLPELAVSTTPAGAALLPLATLDFSGTTVGRDSVRSLYLRNAAMGAISVDSIYLATGTNFSFAELATGGLTGGAVEELKVTFNADAVGTFSDTLTLITSLPGRDSVFRVVLTASTVSGIADLGLGTAVVYPNPVRDIVTVELAEAITDGQWRISNAAGQIVSRGTWPINSNQHRIDMQVLPKGTYRLYVFAGERGMVVQLVR